MTFQHCALPFQMLLSRQRRDELSSRQVSYRKFRLLHVIALLIAVLAWPATAHEVRPIIGTVSAADEGTLEVLLSLNLEAAIAGIGPGHETDDSAAAPLYDELRRMPPEALQRRFSDFAPAFLRSLEITFGDTPAALAVEGVDIPPVDDISLPRISKLLLTGRLPPEGSVFSWRMAPALGDSIVRIQGPGTEEIASATHVPAGQAVDNLTLRANASQRAVEVFGQYVRVGFTHILPKGLDHILFVVGLFLLSTRLSALLWQVSAFTLAHTVTLALGAFQIVTISPAIVEPLIALSIAWIAIENLVTDRLHRWRPIVVFGFGLLHGLGFAGVLDEVGLSSSHFLAGLIAFNVGVELGQLAVIALCFLIVGAMMRRSWYRQAVVIPGSLAIAGVALYWAAERTGVI